MEIHIIVDRLNIKHYPTGSIVGLLKELNEGSMGTRECDTFIKFGTFDLTRKLLKKLESEGLLSASKNALNEYQWETTRKCIELLKETTKETPPKQP